MRDNPYDFEGTVSEYAFPVTENGNKAVTASNLIKAFLFMDKILKIFSMYKNTSVSQIKTNTLLSIPYTFIHKRGPARGNRSPPLPLSSYITE